MIDTCPRCKYSLEGLPERHLCPECGFRYDRNCVVFEEPKPTYKSNMVCLVVVLCVYGFLALWSTWKTALFSGLAVFAVNMGFAAWRWSQLARIVVVSADEIRLWKSPQEETVIPMGQVTCARWDWVRGWIHLESKDGTEIDKISVKFLVTNKLARKVARAINEFRQGDREVDT